MRARIKAHLTYANVAASIALFGVLAGGGAYAASKVGPKDIAKNAVRTKHIKKNAVRSSKIANGAVTEAKLARAVKGKVHHTGRRIVNDPVHGDDGEATASLGNAGPFQFRARCNQGGIAQDRAIVDVLGPAGSSIGSTFGITPEPDSSGPVLVALAAGGIGNNVVDTQHFVAVAPTGEVVSGAVSAEVNDPDGDCVFGVTAVGP